MKEPFPRTGASRAGVSLSTRPDDDALRERARLLLESGALPRRRPDRVWGGPGSGGECPVCGDRVAAEDVEMELEFAGEDGSLQVFVHVHLGCFAALERASRQLASSTNSSEINGMEKHRAAGRNARTNGGPYLDGG